MYASLRDGRRATVHVAEYPADRFKLRVALLPPATSLAEWCSAEGVGDALVGGFYVRDPQMPTDPEHRGKPLGQLRVDGEDLDSVPFELPWGDRRACVYTGDAETALLIERRDRLPRDLTGDLLQAGPMLVRDGEPAPYDDEGFSEGSGQFDSDITIGRHPRAALGVADGRLIAVASEGRTPDEPGLTIDEMAGVMVGLGARSALNLDGGGSTTMIRGGRLVNVPREGDGTEIAGGRAIATALIFVPG